MGHYGFPFYDELPEVDTWVQSWAMIFKDTPSSDYVVGLQVARLGVDIYLIDRVTGQWAFTETCRQVLQLCQRYPQTRTILIEEAANGPAIMNVLGRQVPGVIPVTPEGGKYASPSGAADCRGGQRLVAGPTAAREAPARSRVGRRVPASALCVSDGGP